MWQTLRQACGIRYLEAVQLEIEAEQAGADGVTQLNIAHAVVGCTVFTGPCEPVREMKRLIMEAVPA